MPRLSTEALKAKIAKLQKQLAAAENDKAPAIRKVRALMKKLRVTVEDIVGDSTSKSPRAGKKRPLAAKAKLEPKIPVKYQDGQCNQWSGRGKTPKWLVAFESVGKSREEFRV